MYTTKNAQQRTNVHSCYILSLQHFAQFLLQIDAHLQNFKKYGIEEPAVIATRNLLNLHIFFHTLEPLDKEP